MIKKHPALLFLIVSCVIAAAVYSIGLADYFLFDDFNTLTPLGASGVIDSLEKAKLFIFSGNAGPLGRPISLASFLINANTWPANAISFKKTNLLIHVATALFLYATIALLLKELNRSNSRQNEWVAVLATSFWLLHPFWASTVLYPVQRMTQLPALFTLSGLYIYLHGRSLLVNKPKQAYIVMSIAVLAFSLLAVFSKENGALTPMLILTVEYILLRNKPTWQWRAVFLWLPSVLIAVLLLRYVNFSSEPWPNRNFNQLERVLTQARVLVEYLRQLLIPNIEGKGFFQDGYIVSKNLLQPITTLIAITFIAFLVGLAFAVRKKAPIITLSILFFFAGHLVESTVVGLELYFEHRNYLPAAFLFLPLAFYAVQYRQRFIYLPLMIAVALALTTFLTFERVKLWRDADKLELYWAQQAPESLRGSNVIATAYFNARHYQEGFTFLDERIENLENSALLSAKKIYFKLALNQASLQDFSDLEDNIRKSHLDLQSILAIHETGEYFLANPEVAARYGDRFIQVLNNIDHLPAYKNHQVFSKIYPPLAARISLLLGNQEQALQYYKKALQVMDTPEFTLVIIKELYSTYPNIAKQLVIQAKDTQALQFNKQKLAELQQLEQSLP